MKTRTTLTFLSLAIAGVLLAGCHRNDNGDADQAAVPATTDATTPTDATPSAYDANPPGQMADAGVANGPVSDTDFYRDALDGGRKEVAAGTMASTTAQDAGVKAFADTLVKDHTAMNQQVMQASGMTDAAAPAPDATATADLQGKSGADFDRAFVDMMVMDHQKTIAMFENAAQNASTAEARTLAQGALPKLRSHLQTAQDLQQQLGGAGTDNMGTDATGT